MVLVLGFLARILLTCRLPTAVSKTARALGLSGIEETLLVAAVDIAKVGHNGRVAGVSVARRRQRQVAVLRRWV